MDILGAIALGTEPPQKEQVMKIGEAQTEVT
jgi:hypothetical protein